MYAEINITSPPLTAAHHLAASNAILRKSLQQLSRGVKTGSPADDAGGPTVSMKLLVPAHRQGAAAAASGNAVSRGRALKIRGTALERMKARRPRSTCSQKTPSA